MNCLTRRRVSCCHCGALYNYMQPEQSTSIRQGWWLPQAALNIVQLSLPVACHQPPPAAACGLPHMACRLWPTNRDSLAPHASLASYHPGCSYSAGECQHPADPVQRLAGAAEAAIQVAALLLPQVLHQSQSLQVRGLASKASSTVCHARSLHVDRPPAQGCICMQRWSAMTKTLAAGRLLLYVCSIPDTCRTAAPATSSRGSSLDSMQHLSGRPLSPAKLLSGGSCTAARLVGLGAAAAA